LSSDLDLDLNDAMNILCLTYGDGTSRTFQKCINSLKNGGHKVSVVAWDRLRDHNGDSDGNGIPHRFILRGGGYQNKFLAFWYPLWMLRLSLFLLFKRVDLIWASQFATAIPAAVTGLFNGTRFVYYIHDNLCLSYRIPVITNTIYKWLDRWTMRQASAVIMSNARHVEKHAEPYLHKFMFLLNSPSLKKRPRDDGSDGNRSFCVYIYGSLSRDRGIEVLLKAAEQVPECRIVVAGRLSEKRTANVIQSSRQVEYRGWLDHEDALRLCGLSHAVFAFYDPAKPINIIASPLKLYEAMLMGRPVIMNTEILIGKDVQEWKTGYSCGYHDVDGLVGILREIRANPEEAERKGALARQLFEKKFAWEYFELKLLDLIRSIGNGGSV
jgi:glycosyltransferase involved in cell wall biosynthesis